MRCLVTGASGHLGSYLTELLVNRGEQVFALVRPTSDLWRLNNVVDRLEILRADSTDGPALESAMSRAKPEVVFHLAWEGVTSAFRNDPIQVGNVVGTLKIFEEARDAGCRLWVGVGSQAEYGPSADVLTEETPLQPVTMYGVSKLTAGLLTRELCSMSGMRYVWFRLLATYGPKDDERHLIPSVICKLLKREQPLLTSGEQEWDYLYIADAAEAIYQAAANESVQGVFNLGSGRPRTIRSVIENIRDTIDPTLPLRFGDIDYSEDQQMRLVTSIQRFADATKWKPRTDLEEGLRRTVAWYESQLATIQASAT
jgi:UDP-glucose 4-epimerase